MYNAAIIANRKRKEIVLPFNIVAIETSTLISQNVLKKRLFREEKPRGPSGEKSHFFVLEATVGLSSSAYSLNISVDTGATRALCLLLPQKVHQASSFFYNSLLVQKVVGENHCFVLWGHLTPPSPFAFGAP